MTPNTPLIASAGVRAALTSLLALALPTCLIACDPPLDCEVLDLVEVEGSCVSPPDPDASCDVDNGGCAQRCIDSDEGASCACKDGFEPSGDGKACQPLTDAMPDGMPAGSSGNGSRDGATPQAAGRDAGTTDTCQDGGTACDPEVPAPDSDGDGDGDSDSDGDGVADAEDACPTGASDGEDSDGDGCKDVDEDDDIDGDGVLNPDDNCPALANPEQEDHTGMGVGDACNPDPDGDGVDADVDACEFGATDGTDSDGDGCKDEGEDEDDDDDGKPDADDHCPLVSIAGKDDIDDDGCPTGMDACPSGGWIGPDSDQDGCLDVEDPAKSDAASPEVPKIVYVNAHAKGAGADGTSWAAAFPYLQDGIQAANEAAASADAVVEVWIAAASYFPDLSTRMPDLKADPQASFQPASRVRLRGGFRHADDAGWQRDAFNATILSGDIDGNDSGGASPGAEDIVGRNSCHVVGGFDYQQHLQLDGIVIQGGWASSLDYCIPPGTSSDSVRAIMSGGGIANRGPSTLSRTLVQGNRADMSGGGGFLGGSTSLLDTHWIRNLAAVNSSAFFATALAAHGLHAAGNGASPGTGTAKSAGGAVWFIDGSLVNSTFSGNAAFNDGGLSLGAALTINGNAELQQVTLVGNTSLESGAAIYVPNATLKMWNVLGWDSDPDWLQLDAGSVTYQGKSLVEGLSTGSGAPPAGILEAPSLVSSSEFFVAAPDPGPAPTPSGDLRLLDSSLNPAIDSGSASAPVCPSSLRAVALPDGLPLCEDGKLAVDASGNPRLHGSAADLGAYELSK